jgi:hypothetical protein
LLCAVDVCLADVAGGARPAHCDLDGRGGVEGDQFEDVCIGDVVEPGDELPADGVRGDHLLVHVALLEDDVQRELVGPAFLLRMTPAISVSLVLMRWTPRWWW